MSKQFQSISKSFNFVHSKFVLLVSICVHVHVACVCVAVYWASPLILIFQVMTLIMITPPTWIFTTTLGMARTSRSAQMSSLIRFEMPYDVYSIYESYCEDSFHTMF